MEITEVRIFPADEERFRAYVTVTFDDCFVIKDLKIIRGPKGHFVGMPSKRGKDGRYYEIISAITAEARNMLEEKVFAEYEKMIGEPITRRKLES
jgi:stage V sporulation protein G